MNRVIDISSPPTTRLLRACAAFGLALRRTKRPTRPRRQAIARRILRELGPGHVALITGPSGGGKSSLLADIARQSQRLREPVLSLPHPPREAPIIDLIDGPLADAIATLARAGLADATLLARTPAQLSEGERFRFRLALAMIPLRACGGGGRGSARPGVAIPLRACGGGGRGSARPGVAIPTLLIDEFASTLDRTTARCLCLSLRRWLERAQVRLIVATAHHDVAAWLAPEMTVVVPLGAAPADVTSAAPRALPIRNPQSAIRNREAA